MRSPTCWTAEIPAYDKKQQRSDWTLTGGRVSAGMTPPPALSLIDPAKSEGCTEATPYHASLYQQARQESNL